MPLKLSLPEREASEARPGISKPGDVRGLVTEQLFIRMLCVERKRAERSKRPFLLMILDAQPALRTFPDEPVLLQIVTALCDASRETDLCGWYNERECAIGLIFSELGDSEPESVIDLLKTKTLKALRRTLGREIFKGIHLSFFVFPEEWGKLNEEPAARRELYPDLFRPGNSKKLSRGLKRVMDVTGSLTAIALFSPVFLAVAAAIKLTSRGPVLFRQRRVGQYGETFTFLKFRSMKFQNDSSAHQAYVSQFIAGKNGTNDTGQEIAPVYKLTNDPRVTSVGRFIRKTSLDEFPQFFNVLLGEMSLVGPRPPIPYELECYDIWHRRRLLEVKPGITGLWQVTGRSKTRFDEMVRLDLQYARSWSPWLDIKIILQTPRAVITGEGAY